MGRQNLLFGKSRFDEWAQFHRENPQVFGLFRSFAGQLLRAGNDRMGARSIGERIRWESSIQTTGPEFKVNDHHWPYYARLLCLVDDRFEGRFVFKNKRFDGTDEEILRAHDETMCAEGV